MAKLYNPNDFVQFLEKHWFERTGLAVGLIFTTIIAASFLIQGEAKWGITISVLALLNLIIYIAWWFSRQPPKTPKNKVGFLISVSCVDDAESKTLREDFLIPLRQLMKSGRTGSVFHFIELPQHLAKTIIDHKDAESFRAQCRAHFMLFGRVRLRTINEKQHHFIELDGIVAHRPVPHPVSQSFAREFTELLPRKVLLSTENDLFTFQFTSEWAATVAKYIMGLAAAFSGDLDYAEKLYTDAEEQLKNKNSEFPIFEKLMDRLPIRRSELYEARAMVALKIWGRNHDPNLINELGEHLQRVDESRKETIPNILHLRAIHAFLEVRDVEGAIKLLKKINAKNDGLWHCNMAFLLAYFGDLKGATRHYRQVVSHRVSPEVIEQVESFICWALEEEPDKYQLSYCLGFFNWKVKGDKIQAINDFTTFKKTCADKQFNKEIVLTQKWLQELKKSV